MLRLSYAASAWGTADFAAVLKAELEGLDSDALPLQRSLAAGSYVADRAHEAMIISVADHGDTIRATVGIFYTGILNGCSCADDPTPITEENEYCELRLDIHKKSGETTVGLGAE